MTFATFQPAATATATAALVPQQAQQHHGQQAEEPHSLAFLQAKRQEVAQKLEALISFPDYSLTPLTSSDTVTLAAGNNNSSSAGGPATDQLAVSSVTHVDSNDWFNFASLMDEPATAPALMQPNNCSSNNCSSNSMGLSMPKSVPSQQPFATASSSTSTTGATTVAAASGRVISSECLSLNDSYVVSDRLAEILPELDMKDNGSSPIAMYAPDEEDHNGLAQFFQDPNAWLMPTNTTSTSAPAPMPSLSSSSSSSPPAAAAAVMPPLPMPSLVRKISSGSSTKSGNKSAPKTANERIRERKKTAGAAKRKLGRPSAFPQKLHKMLTAVAHTDVQYNDIVAFVPDGTGFHIHDIDAFVEVILPKYFKMSSFSSFQRQLQLYNFKRVSRGGAYQHPLFHRDAPNDLHKMVRKQSKPSNFVLSVAAKSA